MPISPPPLPIPPELVAKARAIHQARVRHLIQLLDQEAADLAAAGSTIGAAHALNIPAPSVPDAAGPSSGPPGPSRGLRHLRRML